MKAVNEIPTPFGVARQSTRLGCSLTGVSLTAFLFSTPSRQSALADGLHGLNSRNTEPRCDPHPQVEQSKGIYKAVSNDTYPTDWELIDHNVQTR